MRRKPVPEPPAGLEGVATVRDALPRTPRPASDCRARIVARTDVTEEEEARAWLAFLEALGLASAVDGALVRTDAPVESDALADAFVANVYAAREVLDALDEEKALGADAVFERVEESVPRWERERDADWPTRWRARVERLLSWAALLGLAERRDTGYVTLA